MWRGDRGSDRWELNSHSASAGIAISAPTAAGEHSRGQEQAKGKSTRRSGKGGRLKGAPPRCLDVVPGEWFTRLAADQDRE